MTSHSPALTRISPPSSSRLILISLIYTQFVHLEYFPTIIIPPFRRPFFPTVIIAWYWWPRVASFFVGLQTFVIVVKFLPQLAETPPSKRPHLGFHAQVVPCSPFTCHLVKHCVFVPPHALKFYLVGCFLFEGSRLNSSSRSRSLHDLPPFVQLTFPGNFVVELF